MRSISMLCTAGAHIGEIEQHVWYVCTLSSSSSFHEEAHDQTGTVHADGVCEVYWLVSNLVSCENHPCTFMRHFNHFAHFILAHTCILVVQSHLYVYLLFSLTCFHMCLVLPAYSSDALLIPIWVISGHTLWRILGYLALQACRKHESI